MLLWWLLHNYQIWHLLLTSILVFYLKLSRTLLSGCDVCLHHYLVLLCASKNNLHLGVHVYHVWIVLRFGPQGWRFNTNLYCYYLSTRFRPFLVDNEPTSPALPAQCKTLGEMCKKRVIYNNYHTTTTTKARVLTKGPRRKKTKKGKEEEPTTRESEARNWERTWPLLKLKIAQPSGGVANGTTRFSVKSSPSNR